MRPRWDRIGDRREFGWMQGEEREGMRGGKQGGAWDSWRSLYRLQGAGNRVQGGRPEVTR